MMRQATCRERRRAGGSDACCRVRLVGRADGGVPPPVAAAPLELPLSFRPAFGEFEEFVGRYRWRVVLDLPAGEVEPCVP